jgi:hypothetical protein
MGYFKRSWRINDREWSFLMSLDRGGSNELYNLKDDPFEKQNLLSNNFGKATELELKLRRFVADLR